MKAQPAPVSATGSRNTWWFATCPKHGNAAHLSYLGGECSGCAAERHAKGGKS